MTKKTNKPLGIGLEALIPKYQTAENKIESSIHISVNSIITNKNQPRIFFSDEGMIDLIESIKENGIIQPITLRRFDDKKFQIISGERRFRAAKHLKLKTVPAYIINVKNDDDMLKLALIENIQRQDLSSIEEAEGYAILKGKYGFSEKQIAEKIGKSRPSISNKLRLIKLPPELKDALRIKDNDFTEGHARAILGLRESIKMKKFFRKIKKEKLSVRETEKLVKLKSKKIKSIKSSTKLKDSYLTKLENNLISHLGTKVTINSKRKKGNLSIYFSNNDDLERLIDLIINEN
tara:strand:- start:4644 stop:5519 length:876 start_codon:yes stop_codon:yes gene_type:complete